MKTGLTLGGIVLLALGAWMARITDLVTDEQLITAFVNVGAVFGFTWLAWIWGGGVTEFQKRAPLPRLLRIPPPWTARAALTMFEETYGHPAPARPAELRERMRLLKHAEWAKGMIYFASCMNGGVTLVMLLAGYFGWPITFLGWLLLIVYGIGVGGLLLPTVYQVVVHNLWPWVRARGKRGIEVRRDQVTGAPVAIKDLDAVSPKTEYLNRPGDHSEGA